MALLHGNPRDLDLWLRACQTYEEDLFAEERTLYTEASPENLFSVASDVQDAYRDILGSRRKIQPLIDRLDQYSKALYIFSGVTPQMMSPVWGSIRIVLHVANSYGKYLDKILDMFAQIGDLLPRFPVYGLLFPESSLLEALTFVYVDIITFCVDVKRVFQKGDKFSVGLFWRPFEKRFPEAIDRLRDHAQFVEKEVDLALRVEAKREKDEDRANWELLYRRHQEGIHKRRLDQLSSINITYRQRKLQRIRYPNTGLWLTQASEFKNWLSAATSACLWLYGIPGCGKSVLTANVVDHIVNAAEGKGVAVAYFHCDFSASETLVASNILRSILKQILLQKDVRTSGHIIDALLGCQGGYTRSQLTTNELVRVLLYDLEFSEVYVVIDGLECCELQERRDILSIIERLVGNSGRVIKVFVTSREDPEIRMSLRCHQSIRVSEARIAVDIRYYIEGIIDARLRSGELVVQDPSLVDTIIRVLVDGARGMFLSVKFRLDELSNAAIDREIRHILENPPRDLFDSYTKIFGRIRHSTRGLERIRLARKVFEWIIYAKRQLRLGELKEAIAFEPKHTSWNSDCIPADSARITQSCGHLLQFDEGRGDDRIVRLVHPSLREFLMSPPSDATLGHLHFKQPDAEKNIGELCVAYLLFTDFDRSKTTKPASGEQLQKYRLLSYASQHWVTHIAALTEFNTNMWEKLRYLVLYRQTSFKFRPWPIFGTSTQLPHLNMFLWAIDHGNLCLLRLLLKETAGFELHDYADGRVGPAGIGHPIAYPPLIAIRRGHAAVLELLLSVCDKGLLLQHSDQLLSEALGRKAVDMVTMLIRYGIDSKAIDRALLRTSAEGSGLVARKLLEHGTLVDTCDSAGHTPLVLTAKPGHVEIVRLLIAAGADIQDEAAVSQLQQDKSKARVADSEYFRKFLDDELESLPGSRKVGVNDGTSISGGPSQPAKGLPRSGQLPWDVDRERKPGVDLVTGVRSLSRSGNSEVPVHPNRAIGEGDDSTVPSLLESSYVHRLRDGEGNEGLKAFTQPPTEFSFLMTVGGDSGNAGMDAEGHQLMAPATFGGSNKSEVWGQPFSDQVTGDTSISPTIFSGSNKGKGGTSISSYIISDMKRGSSNTRNISEDLSKGGQAMDDASAFSNIFFDATSGSSVMSGEPNFTTQAVEIIAAKLSENETLQADLQSIFSDKQTEQARIQNQLTRILKRYAEDLSKGASNDPEKLISRFIRKRSARVARCMVVKVNTINVQTMFEGLKGSAKEDASLRGVSAYLASIGNTNQFEKDGAQPEIDYGSDDKQQPQQDGPKLWASMPAMGLVWLFPFLSNPLPVLRFGDKDQPIENVSDEDGSPEAGLTCGGIEQAEKFLVAGEPYKAFLENIKNHLPGRIIEERRAAGGAETSGTARGLIGVRSTPDMVPEPTKVRGCWKCKCGVELCDDFIELRPGAVAEMISTLSGRGTSVPARGLGAASRRMMSQIDSRTNGFADSITSSLSFFLHKLRLAMGNARQSASQQDKSPKQEAGSQRKLHLCISQWKRNYHSTKLVQVDLNLDSDEDLFSVLRREYYTILGRWRRIFSLKILEQIRFVYFDIRANKKHVDIKYWSVKGAQCKATQHPDYYPPPNRSDYSYEPTPMDFLPPVGHNYMMHSFMCRGSAESEKQCVARFPGYMGSGSPFETAEPAWGIEFVEGKELKSFWVVGAFVVTISGGFGVLWTKLKGDVQGGFTVAGWIMSTLACVIAGLQAAF